MSYLKENDIVEIQNNVRLLSIKQIDDISHYLFDSHIDEYKIGRASCRERVSA